MLNNKRKFHRFDSDTIVEFRPLKKTNEYSVGMTRDLSSAGFSFESQNYDFEQEEDLEFKLIHPNCDLFVSVQGKAIWKEKSQFACVTGIELKELDNTTRKRMLEIVSDNGNIPDDSFHYGKDKESVVAEKEDVKSEEELLKIYALRASGLLASYLRLHDKILKVSGTFKSLFKRINFEQLYYDSIILLNQSNPFNNELNAYNSKSFDKLSEDQKIYINQLLTFTSKLNITLQILEKRQFLLYKKSQGEDFNWNEYYSIEQQYKDSIEDSIEEYMDEGKRLNELVHLVFSCSKLQETSAIEECFSLNDTFFLLADSVSVLNADEFVSRCRDIGMVEQTFANTDIDQNLPVFDNGYLLRYITDDDTTAMLEVLEKEGRVLQAGIQIIYPKKPSTSNLSEHYKKIVKIAESYYGIGQLIQAGIMGILNYGNNETVFYISKSNVYAINKELLTFRVGNRDFGGTSISQMARC